MHVDSGEYFLGKDRFTLCLQSSYKLTVGGIPTKVNPGEIVWFDNKQPHEAVNVSAKERIAVIFDVPMVQQ
jgi:quercetin dioxygenase-like cupin family protein